MKIGIIKEIKEQEGRVSMLPKGAQALINAGHVVCMEKDAGLNSGFCNNDYADIGVNIVNTEDAWDADLVVKVKEPLPAEYQYLKKQILFTFLHLAAADPNLTQTLLKNKTTAIAYEALEDGAGRLPLLAPMSAIAGNMAVNVGAYYLSGSNSGKGVQLGAVLDERHGKVVIIGDGVAGLHAARVALGMGAYVFLFGLKDKENAEAIERELKGVNYHVSNANNIQRQLYDTDLLIGAVLLRGAKAPHVVSEAMVKSMQAGSVIVDVSIDQGGCIASSRPTSHSIPVYTKHNVIHYCVTNMPGAYPRTATIALSSKTFPYIFKLSEEGLDVFIKNPGLKNSINIYNGKVACFEVAKALDIVENYNEI